VLVDDWDADLELVVELDEPHPARASSPTVARAARRECDRVVIGGDDAIRVDEEIRY
jgi:hypothetical protein